MADDNIGTALANAFSPQPLKKPGEIIDAMHRLIAIDDYLELANKELDKYEKSTKALFSGGKYDTGSIVVTEENLKEFYLLQDYFDSFVLGEFNEGYQPNKKVTRTLDEQKERPFFYETESSIPRPEKLLEQDDIANILAKRELFDEYNKYENPVKYTIKVLEEKRASLIKQLENDEVSEKKMVENWDVTAIQEKQKKGEELSEEEAKIEAARNQAKELFNAKDNAKNHADKIKKDSKESLAYKITQQDQRLAVINPFEQSRRLMELKVGRGISSAYNIPGSIFTSGVRFVMDPSSDKPKVSSFGIASTYYDSQWWASLKQQVGWQSHTYDPEPGARFATLYYKNIINAAKEKGGVKIGAKTAIAEKPFIIQGIKTAGNPEPLLRYFAAATAAAKKLGAKNVDISVNDISSLTHSSTETMEFTIALRADYPGYLEQAEKNLEMLIKTEAERQNLNPDEKQRKQGEPSDQDILGRYMLGKDWDAKDLELKGEIKTTAKADEADLRINRPK
jgi:hypothetical protein